MSMLLAIIAFVMAFGALWFTSEVARRLDQKDRSLLRPRLTPVQGASHAADQQIRDLSRNLLDAEHRIRALNAQIDTFDTDSNPADDEPPQGYAPISTLDILRNQKRFYPSDT